MSVMRRRVVAFDLDGTLAVTKSPITDLMVVRLSDLLALYDVCIISGGAFPQFETQVIARLSEANVPLSRLHLMPTSGTRYFTFDDDSGRWMRHYSEDLSEAQKAGIIEALSEAARELGYWEREPFGEIIEDRGSQVTYSALGQQAPPDRKHAWDPDGSKKLALRDLAARKLPGMEVRVGGTTSVDVTKPGIDKAYGMRKLMSALGCTPGEILFVGDQLQEGGNDHPVRGVGIDTISVARWEDTALVIEAIAKVS